MTAQPTTAWALVKYDPVIKENRLHAVYWHAMDANTDALAMSNADSSPTVEPFDIQTGPQYSSPGEAATELDVDFDVEVPLP
jgi:hypothetical protein